MPTYKFDVSYSSNTILEIEAENEEAARDEVHTELEFLSNGNLNYYQIESMEEVAPKPQSIAHFACGLQLEDENE